MAHLFLDQSRPILFLSHASDLDGGAEKALLEMLTYLAKKGRSLHVIVGAEGKLSQELTKLGIPFTVITLYWWVHSGSDDSPFNYQHPDQSQNPLLRVVEIIKSLQPQLCVTNTVVAPWLAYASSITEIKHVWLVHELIPHSLKLDYGISPEQIIRNMDQLSDAVFFNSKYAAGYYTEKFHNNKHPHIVYPGGSFPPPEVITSPFRQDAFKLVAVGQIKPQKGQFDAIKAMKQLVDAGKDVQLVVVGAFENTEYVQEITSYIGKWKLRDNVILTGYQKNPSSYVTLADAGLMCATNEAFGRVTVEAMLLGKPVIGADSGATNEIIRDTETGFLYKPGNIDELSGKISKLIDDPDETKKMGRRAKEIATKTYSDDHRYADFVKYVENINSCEKTALDLSPLDGAFTDFQISTQLVKTLRQKEAQLELIQKSRGWRLLRSIMRIVGK
jgi:glycosyltransferase involved in cell wall biosynthesis